MTHCNSEDQPFDLQFLGPGPESFKSRAPSFRRHPLQLLLPSDERIHRGGKLFGDLLYPLASVSAALLLRRGTLQRTRCGAGSQPQAPGLTSEGQAEKEQARL